MDNGLDWVVRIFGLVGCLNICFVLWLYSCDYYFVYSLDYEGFFGQVLCVSCCFRYVLEMCGVFVVGVGV